MLAGTSAADSNQLFTQIQVMHRFCTAVMVKHTGASAPLSYLVVCFDGSSADTATHGPILAFAFT